MEGQPEPLEVSEEVFVVKWTGCSTLMLGKILAWELSSAQI